MQRKKYHFTKSPFYCLCKRSKLAKYLDFESASDMEWHTKNARSQYRFFKDNGRPIQSPKITSRLKKAQKTIGRFLTRIESPNYLHSGLKGKSYKSNANEHAFGVPVLTMDIHKFFAKSRYHWIHDLFLNRFKCSPDVASVLTKLSCVDGHIPTGGHASTILSFYAYQPMFDAIYDECVKYGITMTVYVDDMTFSGIALDDSFRHKIEKIVSSFGLKINRKKTRLYPANKVKVITGIAVTRQGLRIPNDRRKVLYSEKQKYKKLKDKTSQEAIKLQQRVLGLLCEAESIEPRFAEMRKHFMSKT